MKSLIPIHEIEERRRPQGIRIANYSFGVNEPQSFSVGVACRFIDLCARAESEERAFLAEEQGEDTFVAFRSSGDPASILNVRGATQVDGVAIGEGLGYGPLVKAYRDSVQSSFHDFNPGKRLWLTGHGLGGAFAVFGAIEALGEGAKVAAVYTFGAPRVGDAKFVNSLNCPVFRVVNDLDVVVTMPTAWKWRHAGSQKLINADGSLNRNPHPLNRLPSLMRQTVWLGEMLKEGLSSGFPRAIYTLLNRVLGDHDLEAYREKLHTIRD